MTVMVIIVMVVVIVSVRHFVVTIRAVFDAIVDLIDIYLGTIHAIEPVDFFMIAVVLLFI